MVVDTLLEVYFYNLSNEKPTKNLKLRGLKLRGLRQEYTHLAILG